MLVGVLQQQQEDLATVSYHEDLVTVSHHGDPETVSHRGDLAMASHHGDLATVLHRGDPATVSHRGDLATVLRRGDPATVSHRGDPAMASHHGHLATVLHRGDPATASHHGHLATVLHRGDPATASHHGGPATVSHHESEVHNFQTDLLCRKALTLEGAYNASIVSLMISVHWKLAALPWYFTILRIRSQPRQLLPAAMQSVPSVDVTTATEVLFVYPPIHTFNLIDHFAWDMVSRFKQ
jgi:hypothetical protein